MIIEFRFKQKSSNLFSTKVFQKHPVETFGQPSKMTPHLDDTRPFYESEDQVDRNLEKEVTGKREKVVLQVIMLRPKAGNQDHSNSLFRAQRKTSV